VRLPSSPERRAARLVRAYPRHWRDCYGAELAELLAEDITIRPTSPRRIADVALNAGVVRLRTAGLVGPEPAGASQVRSGLATVWLAGSVLLLLGMAMLSQIAIGWRWEPPSGRAIAVAMILMATAGVLVTALGIAAALPILAALVRHLAGRRLDGLWRPALLVVGGMTTIALGAHHFEAGWPGSGGHPWAYHAVLPAGPTSFAWASTLSITSYWAHPGALRSFPTIELAWMALSPIAVLATLVGVVKIVRRVEVSDRVLRFQTRIASASIAVMGVFLLGATCWVTGRDPAIHGGLYQVGTVDVIELVVMLGALGLAVRAIQRTGSALRLV
jgi:hypothetical protein